MPADPIDTRDHDLAGCRRRHGDEGPAAGQSCLSWCDCRCHIRPHEFVANPDLPSSCVHCERPEGDRLHDSRLLPLCAWPKDGHTPSTDNPEAYTRCERPYSGRTGWSPAGGHVVYCAPLCLQHIGSALGAGWQVSELPPLPASLPPERAAEMRAAVVEVAARRLGARRPGVPRSIPDPMPPLFPRGHKPRGVVDPVIAYGIMAAVTVLLVAGDLWEVWADHRRRVRLARRLAKIITEEGPYG